MNNMFYLLNLTVSGIKSIKKDVCLEFYKKTIDKTFDPSGYRVKAIYGENGSGKSALVTAVKIFQDIIFYDNYLSESKNQSFLDEIVNKETGVFKFVCEFIVNTKTSRFVYKYSIQLGKNDSGLFEIQYESLEQKNGTYPNNNYKPIFECTAGEISNIDLEENEKENIIRKTLNLLNNHSFIYLYMNNLKKDVFETENQSREFTLKIIFSLLFVCNFKIYLAEEDQHEWYFLRKKLRESNFEQQAFGDQGFERIGDNEIAFNVNEKRVDKDFYENYEKKVQQLTQFIKIFKPELVTIDIEKKEDGDQYVCELILNYGAYRINKEFESTGIKKLIRLFDCFLMASSSGIVFIDEMDSNLNDVYLCKLIEYFMYYGKGQLCFTTHNLDPMMVLKENKNSIDFISSDNIVVSWTKRGGATPDNYYRNGMIEDSPFNIAATDFIGIFGE